MTLIPKEYLLALGLYALGFGVGIVLKASFAIAAELGYLLVAVALCTLLAWQVRT